VEDDAGGGGYLAVNDENGVVAGDGAHDAGEG